ncbi:Hypothetical protein CINCED_3A008910 [Cinara cedri]|uniref:Uncharacterized protein n=1 Tax=Cinara cedri TaxID=506608 RepID=A0A5E4M7V1_9HEMI|nr:Hypothetical protein CINCED_3A008910 [Cinara cedri]
MADLIECFIATGSSFNRNHALHYYDAAAEEEMHFKSVPRYRQIIKKKLQKQRSYLARFTDNYYINRVKHPTF